MTYPRTSPVHSELEKLEPVWGELHAMACPLRYAAPEVESECLRNLALCDLSALPKLGLKGKGAEEWLLERGCPIPDKVYEWETIEEGGLIVRVDGEEFFLEDGLTGRGVADLAVALGGSDDELCRVQRQDTGLLLSGKRAVDVLRQTCSFNFEGAREKLVMTRVALVSCAILPTRIRGTLAFRLWFVPSYGIYLWQNLFQIVKELGGHAVGYECLGGTIDDDDDRRSKSVTGRE